MSLLLSRLSSVNVQVKFLEGEPVAVDRLVDIVRSKLINGDSLTYNQLVYSLVMTDQLTCARLLDEELTDKYRQERRDSKHGQQYCLSNLLEQLYITDWSDTRMCIYSSGYRTGHGC